MESAILIIMALGGLGAVGVGLVLLVLYWRAGRQGDYAHPVVYGNLVQCPRCNYMNPVDSAACLNCRLPLAHVRQQYQPPPSPTYPTLPPHYQQRPVPSQPYEPAASPPVGMTRPAPAAEAAPRQSNLPRAWLEGIAGVVAGNQIMLSQIDTLFGRSTQCDVQVYDPKVSRQHFRIRYGNGAFFLQDQESSRGTMINGEKVMAQRLLNGDQIQLGDSVLVFHIEA